MVDSNVVPLSSKIIYETRSEAMTSPRVDFGDWNNAHSDIRSISIKAEINIRLINEAERRKRTNAKFIVGAAIGLTMIMLVILLTSAVTASFSATLNMTSGFVLAFCIAVVFITCVSCSLYFTTLRGH